MSDLPRLTTAQAAGRLGVKPATLYAYVSRGLIASIRSETGGSTFDALDVEELAESMRRPAQRAQPTRPAQPAGEREAPHQRLARAASARSGRPLMVLDSELTLIENDELFYRGRRATDLVAHGPAERVMEFFLASTQTAAFTAPDDVVRRARAAGDLLGSPQRMIDRLALTVTLAGSLDPLRDDLDPEVVFSAGRRLIGAMVDALPPAGGAPPVTGAAGHPHASLAERLWPKLSARPAMGGDLAMLDAALILCIDHDLAVATLAARVAASARAHPYAAVSAALGAFDSSLHGSMSVTAAEMLREAMGPGGIERAVARHVSAGRGIPGFGHSVYRSRDPRFVCLMLRMHGEPRYSDAVRTTERLVAIVNARVARPANLDLALATFVAAADLVPDAGHIIFAIARTAGWLAHVVAEYSEPPLRLRPESHYTGLTM
ncbi:citrate/2-methylcitrate synthase [Subtercola lobariae]|nr:citrate/2-methylcitrate synthase [Subtercola lobariae]